MSRVLIAGCGSVGTHLAKRLDAEGHKVWGLRRSAEPLPGRIQTIQADLCDASSLGAIPDNLDAVIYTAGASEFSEEAYENAYVSGIKNLLEALRQEASTPKRILFTSSTAVYAQQDGETVDESSETSPEGFSGQAMLRAEALLRASPIESVSLRLGGIYGPGRTALIDRVRRGEAKREATTRYLNLIHVEDIVGALLHLMTLSGPAEVYVGVDSDPQPRNELLSWIAEQLDVPEPPLTDGPDSQRPPRNRRCSNARLLASGYRFHYPSCREGYAELIRAAR